MDEYQFDETFKAIRGFAWDVLADNYIELAKSRLYGKGKEKMQPGTHFFQQLRPFQGFLHRLFLISRKRSTHT